VSPVRFELDFYIQEDGILHSQRRENRKSYIALNGGVLVCEFWGFHGCDYEECRLLGYKNPVRTLQETHYISATDPSRLMLGKI
jgi:hypothetical protein